MEPKLHKSYKMDFGFVLKNTYIQFLIIGLPDIIIQFRITHIIIKQNDQAKKREWQTEKVSTNTA